MALYLGNNKVSMKSGYITTGFKDFLEHGGRFSDTNYTDLTGILKYEDTSNVTNMRNMFSGCPYLTTIPKLDTSRATSMENMFSASVIVTIPKLDTSNVSNMSGMFGNCSRLKSVPQFDTSNVTEMNNMFYNCRSLTSVPKLNTSNTRMMASMFEGCINLTSVPELDASKVTFISGIFNRCGSLTSIGMYGFTRSIDISKTSLEHDAIVAFLNQAGTAYDSSQKITMGSTKLALLSDAEKSIATNKGWTLA